ncbi:MAG: hypothetical protein LR011_07115 [Verrucomicrobia bacterium]|nr:hypothetical protein [Verrucomicrobiota bacterium]
MLSNKSIGSVQQSQKLIVREYQTSSRSRCGIILDVQCPVARAFDFEVLVSLAASIASAGESAQLDLDFLFVGDQAYCFSTGSGQGEIDQLMQVLASVKYSQQDNWPALRRVVEENADHLQGATFLTLHWNPDRKSMAQFLDKLSIPNQSFVVIPGDSDPENASYHDPDFPNTHFLHPDRIQLQLANL